MATSTATGREGPGPISLVTVFLAGAVSALVGLALCLAVLVWWIKTQVLSDANGPNPKPASKDPKGPNGSSIPSEAAAAAAAKASHTSTSRRALELLLREKDAKDDASSLSSSSSPSRGNKSSATNNQLMGWLNIYRVPVQCEDTSPDPIPAASSSNSILIDSHSPTSPPVPPPGYIGAGHQYAALHRPRSMAAASSFSSERLPGALSSSNPDLLWPPLATSPSSTTFAAATTTSGPAPAPAPAPSSASTTTATSSSSRRSSTTFASTPHTRAFDRAKSPTCFGVLRHHSLFLYDDETLLDCVGVVLLPLHSVALHAPPGAAQGRVPWDDSECFAKDTPIRLSRVASKASGLSKSKDAWDPVMAGVPLAVGQEHPAEQRDFFLYAMNAVEKEAWYLALRRASATGTHELTHPPHFYASYSALRATLLPSPTTSLPDHSTLWLNALIGRAFLTVQDHPLLTRYLLSKFTKKLDRLPALPGFLSSLRVASVDPGSAAPILSNPALVKCDASGHIEVELDVAYTGRARVQLAADVVLSLGTTVASIAGKLGAGDGVAADLRVPVVLGVTLAEVRGRLRVALRPPPSNRAWVGFVDAPRLVVRAEPVVNTKQLRLAMVLDLIESKVRDLLVASMVLPNMEDVCIAPSGWGDESGEVEGGRFYPKAGEGEGGARPESVRSMATSVAASSTAGGVGRERSRSITSMWSAMSATSATTQVASAPTSPRTRLSTIPASPADSLHAPASSAAYQRAMVVPLPPRPTTSTSLSSPPTTLSRSSTTSSNANSSASSLSPWTSLAAASTLNSPGSEYPRSVKRGFGVVHRDEHHDGLTGEPAHVPPPVPAIPAHFVEGASDDSEGMLRHRRAYSASAESAQGATTATSRVVAAAAAAAAGSSKSAASTSTSSSEASASASSFSFRSLFRSSSSGDGGRRG